MRRLIPFICRRRAALASRPTAAQDQVTPATANDLPPASARPARKRGVAIIMVQLILLLMITVVADFQYNSFIDYKLAINARDELQAEYNALSAMRMRSLLLKQSRKLKGAMEALGAAVGMDKSAMPPIGQLIEMIPVECGLMSAITREAGVDKDDEKDNVDFFKGECIATAVSEHSKISINMLANRSNKKNDEVRLMLLGLLSGKKNEKHFENDDLNGVHAESPVELVAALTDWVDNDDDQFGTTASDEERHYGLLRDPYRPKNAPYDSLAELQLVHGVDDELYALLANNVSIYTDNTKIELATAPLERIFVVGLPAILRQGAQLPPGALVPLLADLRDLKAGFGKLNVAGLKTLIQSHGLDAYFDTAALGNVFTDSSNPSWYTIEAQGRVGNVSRRIKAVFQAQEGRFYYLRIE